MNPMLNRIIRQVVNQLLNRSISAGMKQASKMKSKKGDQDHAEGARQNPAPKQLDVGQAQKSMRILRRFMRF